jgi:hypothetical protein
MVTRVLALLLITLVVSLGPLAFASPPDPSWIGGFYDDNDFDDVIILIMAAPSAPPAGIVRGLEPNWTPAYIVAPADDPLRLAATQRQHPTRGPPVS